MRFYSLVAAIALASASLAAHADTFNFSYSGTGTSASGTLTGQLTRQGVYTITGITGTRNGSQISGLDPNDAFADQLLYLAGTDTGTLLTPTYLDNSGIAFDVDGVDYDIFTSATRPTVVENDLGPAINLIVTPGTTPVAVTPEPSSLALLGTGLLGHSASLASVTRNDATRTS